MKSYNSYVICATPRSGSTLLCKLLAATGVAGKPESYFHNPELSAWTKALDLHPDPTASKPEILSLILQTALYQGRAGSDIFGLRLMRRSFDFLIEQLNILYPDQPNDTARFQAAFGSTLYIHLSREDKLAQAISRLKADQTGLWHLAPDGTELERSAPPQKPTYDADTIGQYLAELTEYDNDWNHWFEQQNIAPLRVTYEELSADPASNLIRILERLGLDKTTANGIAPGVTKLADETSLNWAERFRAERP